MKVQYDVHPKETIYFVLKLIVSIAIYFLLCLAISSLYATEDPRLQFVYRLVLEYIGILILLVIFQMTIIIGYIKGNAIKVSSRQFPDIYNIVAKQQEELGLSAMPDVYILQSGGVLNAFVTAFFGTNYIVLYSEVLAAAYEQNPKTVEFIIGHEMGHIKRRHLIKRLLLLPGALVPFLGAAYSRACEYTCDRIGYALCPEGARPGMVLLASGKGLLKKVNVQAFIEQIDTERSFSKWFAEKFASHPNLNKRVREFREVKGSSSFTVDPIPVKEYKSSDDHSKYFPK